MPVNKKTGVSIPFDAIGENLARLMDVKRRLSETSIRTGNSDYARDILDEVRDYVRCIREGLEAEYRDGSLKDMTPARARQAIYGCQILEETLQARYPELCH
jgi:hypothetical protein